MKRKFLPVSVSGRIGIEISIGNAKPKYANIFDAIYERIKERVRR